MSSFLRQEIECYSSGTIDYKRLEKTTQYFSLVVSVVCSTKGFEVLIVK